MKEHSKTPKLVMSPKMRESPMRLSKNPSEKMLKIKKKREKRSVSVLQKYANTIENTHEDEISPSGFLTGIQPDIELEGAHY